MIQATHTVATAEEMRGTEHIQHLKGSDALPLGIGLATERPVRSSKGIMM